jgi:hypothetical protein
MPLCWTGVIVGCAPDRKSGTRARAMSIVAMDVAGFPRERWQAARSRAELGRTGVYILVGYKEGDDEDLPTLYIGEGDAVRERIDSHAQNKEFW